MRILLVVSDFALSFFLQKGLTFDGHAVSRVKDGAAAVLHVMHSGPDLVVLDMEALGADGLQVLHTLQQCSEETKILALTGRTGVQERVIALDLGADDCMMKPISLQELQARCRAIARRCQNRGEALLRHSNVVVDRIRRAVSIDGISVNLTAKEFSLLEYLMLHRGRPVSRAELLREVWKMTPDAGTNVVDVYINYLRRKLGQANPMNLQTGSLIETVRGEGYCLSRDTVPMGMVALSPDHMMAVSA